MRTCGLDVHKDTIFCAIYDGRKASVEKFSTFTPDIEAMCAHLSNNGVVTAAMESTGIYIDAIRTTLRRNGLGSKVANPLLIKQMPGRKSDAKDAVWIAKLDHKGMLPSSFSPDEVLAELRTYTRSYVRFVQRQSSVLTSLDRILVSAGIRLRSVLSSTSTKSFLEVARCIAAGETRPDELLSHVYGRARKKPELRDALTGCIEGRHIRQLQQAFEEYDMYERRIAQAREKMEGLAKAHYHEELRLVQTIPGISLVSAICIIAEISVDMSVFGTSGRLCGWAGLRPRNDESAGKLKSRAVTKGGRHLKPMLVQCAWGAARTKGSKFQETFGRLVARKGEKKAIVAVARKLLVTVYTLLKTGEEYIPEKAGKRPSGDQLARQLRYHIRQCERISKSLPEAENVPASVDLKKTNNEKAVYLCGSARPDRT